ncbi:MAG: hypothetical protein Q9163_004879 [Psora crenata]
MEPGIAAAAYGAQTVAEGAVAAGVAIAKATMPLKASWRRIPTTNSLPRSSHSLAVIRGKAYIFGGEEKPRDPVNNHVHVFTLQLSEHDMVDYQVIPAVGVEGSDVPSARVGHTAAAVNDRLYVFGGRGGKAMQPLEENGRVWVFDTRLNQWSFLNPAHGSPFPAARSYHSSTSTDYPLSDHTDQGMDPVDAASSGFADHGTIFIHGGCLASGRTADVWGFDIVSRMWSRYSDAPGAPRGGSGLTFSQNRLYRFGGFDGKQELGGSIDFLHFTSPDVNFKGDKGGLAIAQKTGQWESIAPPEATMTPGNRSVCGLQPVTTGQGRIYLLLFLGEKDPSSSGHDAAGKFWDDVWSFQIESEGMTAASFKDATRAIVGSRTGKDTWARVDVLDTLKSEGIADHPGPRGWFASSQAHDLGPESIVLWGGVLNDNSRAGDGWFLTVES